MTETRICRACGEEKPLTPEHFRKEDGWDKGRTRIIGAWFARKCLDCQRAQSRAWKKRNAVRRGRKSNGRDEPRIPLTPVRRYLNRYVRRRGLLSAPHEDAADSVRAGRAAANVVTDLAKRANVPQRQLDRYRRGETKTIGLYTADRILCALGLVHAWRCDPELSAVYFGTEG